MMVHCINFSESIITPQKQHVHGPFPHTSSQVDGNANKGIALVCIGSKRSFSAK